jgi:hypothetical protein
MMPSKKTPKLESTLVGVAGEYLVAGELTLRGYIASITLRNSRGIDIIASSADGSHSLSVQVKTSSSGKPNWILNKKAETFYADNHFYIFVALTQIGTRPAFHIVPSQIVASRVSNGHATWLSGAKANGSPRKDTNMRKFNDSENKYLEAWHHLNKPA